MPDPTNTRATFECFVVVVDGVPTDLRDTSALAIRQSKVRKDSNPGATVEIHYAPVITRTYHNGNGLVTENTAQVSSKTLLARVAGTSDPEIYGGLCTP